MNIFKMYKLIFSLLIITVTVCAFFYVFHNKIQEIHTTNQYEVELVRHFKLLLESQNVVSDLSDTEKAVLFTQTLENVLETGNLSYFFPIPLNERKRTVIFSSWRSGSTFLGDIFTNLPANYYDYEPFNYLGISQIETNNESIAHVKDLLNCKYRTGSTREHMHNPIHWPMDTHMNMYCDADEELCHSVTFREAFCNIFPRQNMKLVRARITLAEALLTDPDLNVNVILLIRDPRAIFASRRRFFNCQLSSVCYNMKYYCKYLVDDYKAAKILLEKFPTQIKVLRLENLALNPHHITKEIFDQFGIEFDKNIVKFLNEHTNAEEHKMWDTYRNSKAVVSQWMNELNMEEVIEIQTNCTEAMELWGYTLIEDGEQILSSSFNPVGDYFI